MVGMDRFRVTFLNECAELLADMESRLVSIIPETATTEDLDAIFRCAHSIKGGAGAFGYDRVVGFTHKLEALLDDMRVGRVPVIAARVSTLLEAVDITTAILQAESNGLPLDDTYGHDVASKIQALSFKADAENTIKFQTTIISQPIESSEIISTFLILFVPHENLFMTGNDPLLLFRELKSLGTMRVRVDVARLPVLNDFNAEACYLAWEIHLTTDRDEAAIQSVFEFVEDDCDLTIVKVEQAGGQPESPIVADQKAPQEERLAVVRQGEAKATTAVAKGNDEVSSRIGVSSIRVDLEKIDRLVNMVGELVITQAMLQMQTRGLPIEQFPELLRGVDELSHHMRDLQEAVMSVRMQPVKSVFSRMPRIVRDIAQQLGKDIQLVMSGEATEVDKTIIELLSDPLTHMIRNAADHGIEMPDVRRAAGKPTQGTIHLSAAHQSGRIVIEVAEDGAGLNHEKILAKANSKGLVGENEKLTLDAIAQLIFMPGLSTAEQVSNISGRGVGMDVVRRNIESMGGTVHVSSEPGKGTRFTIVLPLTLAILDGMIVRAGHEKYIVPITSIVETLRPQSGAVYAVPESGDVLNARGEFIPLVYLHELFNIDGACHDPSKALVVLIESGVQKLGVVVDELLGQQQVVIKSLETNADPVHGVSGATILGDGKVSLILDTAALAGMANNNNTLHPQFMKEAI